MELLIGSVIVLVALKRWAPRPIYLAVGTSIRVGLWVTTFFLLVIVLAALKRKELLEQSIIRVPGEYPYHAVFDQAAAPYGIDPLILAAQAWRESAFDPLAVSEAGAIGIGQIMPATATECGLVVPTDPITNIKCQAYYMNWLLDLDSVNGDMRKALCSYYLGPTGCQQNPTEANEYIRLILGPVPPYAHGRSWRLTQGWHGLAGYEGYDMVTSCSDQLYAPLTGIVAWNGCDGYVGPLAFDRGACGEENTMLAIDGILDDEKVILLHGNYDPALKMGTPVIAGYTPIGTEDYFGNSTGCHTHYIYYKTGITAVPPFIFGR